MKKQPVLVSFLYESKEKTPPDLRPTMQADTDANGEVSFHLPEPAPAHFGAQIRLTSENWRCACYALAITQEVIEKGVTLGPTNEKSGDWTRARPGEILFIARPPTFFERVVQPLVRQ